MKMTVHSDVNVLYIELREGEQAQTPEVDSSTYIDLDAENRVLGVEVLNAREFLNDFLARGGQLNVPDTISGTVRAGVHLRPDACSLSGYYSGSHQHGTG